MEDGDSIVFMSQAGQAIRISMRDVRVMGRSTQGVRLANLKNGSSIVAMQKIESESEEAMDEVEEGAPDQGLEAIVEPSLENQPSNVLEGE